MRTKQELEDIIIKQNIKIKKLQIDLKHLEEQAREMRKMAEEAGSNAAKYKHKLILLEDK